MKRRELHLVRQIAKAAKAEGLSFEQVRSRKHDAFSLDGLTVPIHQHMEIGEGLGERHPQGVRAETRTEVVAMTRKTYAVTAQRDGRYWLLRVPAVERSTQALRLDQAEDMARDLIAIMTGDPEEAFDVEVTTKLDPKLSALLSEVRAAKAEAAERQKVASTVQREAVRQLVESGYTVRDTGRLLGLTYQRVAQLRADQEPRGNA